MTFSSLWAFELDDAAEVKMPLYNSEGVLFARIRIDDLKYSAPKIGFLTVNAGRVLAGKCGVFELDDLGFLATDFDEIDSSVKRLTGHLPQLDRVGVRLGGEQGFSCMGQRFRQLGPGRWELVRVEACSAEFVPGATIVIQFSREKILITDKQGALLRVLEPEQT